MCDAQRARHGQGVDLQAADEHRVGPQRQRLEHVATTADATIEQQRTVRPHGRAHRRQRAQARGRAVQAAPAVVGDHQSRHSPRLQGGGVLGMQYTLDPDRQTALGQQPVEIRPARRLVHQALEDATLPRRESRGSRCRIAAQIGGDAIGRQPETRFQRAPAGLLYSGIEGQNDGLIARGFGTTQQVQAVFPPWLQIQLEPALRTGHFGDLLQAKGRQAAAQQAGPGRRRGARGLEFATRMHELLVGERRQKDGMRQRLTLQLQAALARAQVAQQSRIDGPVGIGRPIGL